MNKTDVKILIWYQDDSLFKAKYEILTRCVTIMNEDDEILIKRKNISSEQFCIIELVLLQKGAKQIETHKQPFTYITTR